jgi:hypothetical protein
MLLKFESLYFFSEGCKAIVYAKDEPDAETGKRVSCLY